MNEIPLWWLILSGLFFGLNVFFLFALGFVMIKLGTMVKGMQPKLVALEGSVQSLVEKVGGIATNVEELTATVKSTVADVGGNARVVATNAQMVSQTASREFEKYSPLVMGALTAFKLIRAVGEMRAKHRIVEEERVTKKKGKSKLGLVLAIASHFLGK